MNELLWAFTGVFLQVLGLVVALLNLGIGAAGLVIGIVLKEPLRSSKKDEPEP